VNLLDVREDYERADFNRLYHAKNYVKAYQQLSFYLNKCKTELDKNTILWIKNDLVLALAKNRDQSECKIIINEIENEKAITVYPNPSSDKITVSFSSNEKGMLQVLNALGQLIYSKEINSSMEEIDVSQFTNGIYLIITTSATQKLESVFLKQ
jgi:hypothetical protein